MSIFSKQISEALVIVTMYLFGWYFVVRNHSVIHPWIEFRELGVFMFGLICCCGLIIGNNEALGGEKNNG